MGAMSIKLWLLPRNVRSLLALTIPHLVTALLLKCHDPRWYELYFFTADLRYKKMYVIGTGIKLANYFLS